MRVNGLRTMVAGAVAGLFAAYAMERAQAAMSRPSSGGQGGGGEP